MSTYASALDRLQFCRCPICDSGTGQLHRGREMMLGTGDLFPYWECAVCGCVSLTEVPDNLAKYYPSNYYSLQRSPTSKIRKLRDRIYLSPASFLVNWRRRTDLDVIRRVRLRNSMTLLEVGCGDGRLLNDLRVLGYTASGVDPFVSNDIYDRFGMRVERKTLADVQDVYDVILFRHSLEHMPVDSLRLARACIKSNGVCVVCIPIIGWAWQFYGTNWAQLDAPRHFFLHSRKSFGILAEKSGFRIERVVFDSNEFQVWASESYKRNIPLNQASTPALCKAMRMRRLAASLNRKELGDTAQFYLRPTP